MKKKNSGILIVALIAAGIPGAASAQEVSVDVNSEEFSVEQAILIEEDGRLQIQATIDGEPYRFVQEEEEESTVMEMVDPEPMDTTLPDGTYSVEVTLTGGSGKASISSPTLLYVTEGKVYAKLTWSSTNYDYMLMGSRRFENENTDGGYSTFTIPVTQMNQEIPIIADTTAMGGHTEISYTLHFFEDSIGSKDQIPQEAAKKVVIVALMIIVGGGILNSIVKKRRRVSRKPRKR